MTILLAVIMTAIVIQCTGPACVLSGAGNCDGAIDERLPEQEP